MTRPGTGQAAAHDDAAGGPGPFDTERQARELPAVREVYRQFDIDPGVGKMQPHNLRMLLDALAAAGVYVGAYDVRIAQWLAGWEPATVAVIAGWVERASQARMREGPPGERAGGPAAKPDRHRHASSPPTPRPGPVPLRITGAEALAAMHRRAAGRGEPR